MSRTAFVTGATGFVGLNVVEQLRARDWHVVALRRATSATDDLDHLGAEQREGDICERESLEAAMPTGCDAVFHVAANTSVWKRNAALQRAVNVEGTRNVIETALEKGAKRLVLTSTWNTFDWSTGMVSEATPQTAGTSWINYNRTKFEAEEIVRAAIAERGLDAVIVNPTHIVGRYDRHNWAQLILLAAIGKLPGVPPGAGSFAHGEAVAKAHIAAAERGGRGENYVLGGPNASFLEFVQTVARLAHQRKVPKRTVPAVVMKLMAGIEGVISTVSGKAPQVTPEAVAMVTARVGADSSKAIAELGYAPPSLETAIDDAYSWMLREKLLYPKSRR